MSEAYESVRTKALAGHDLTVSDIKVLDSGNRGAKRHTDDEPPPGPWGPKHIAWMFGAMAHETADFVRAFVAKKLTPIEAENTALREKVMALEARTWVGIWEPEKEYIPQSLVTSGGAVWLCLAESNKGLRPGQTPSYWRLVVKAGRDGKDCKCGGGEK